MRFKSNTKPIVDGLDLCIIDSNVSKFYQKSCIVELTIQESSLRINTEVSSIKGELVVKGQVSGDGENHIFVDSLLFKKLLKTIETNTVEFEIKNDVLTVYAGKSKFNLPQMIAGEDLELSRPQSLEAIEDSYNVDVTSWEFIKNNQMYAIAMSFIHPVYTNVWLGESGDVIVGDFDNSIFTHSNQSGLGSKCLITDTIVNLLTTIPEDSKIIPIEKNFEIAVETDPFTYLCEFTPKYEEDDGVGDYNSDIILSLFEHDNQAIKLNIDEISKYISQAELFTSGSDDKITLTCTDDTLALTNENVNCLVDVVNPFGEFTVDFKIGLLDDAISHMDNNEISIMPLVQDDEYTGIVMWTANMSTVVAGAE